MAKQIDWATLVYRAGGPKQPEPEYRFGRRVFTRLPIGPFSGLVPDIAEPEEVEEPVTPPEPEQLMLEPNTNLTEVTEMGDYG